MYKTWGNSIHLKTQPYISLKTLLLWRLGRDKWGTYSALLSRNSFSNFLLGAFGDLITSFGSNPAPLVMSCIQLIACDSPSPILSWHWKHHSSHSLPRLSLSPSPILLRNSDQRWGQHPIPQLCCSSLSMLPFPTTPPI